MARPAELRTDLADARGLRPGMFDYLEPRDVDARFGGGVPPGEAPRFRFGVVGAGVAGQGDMIVQVREGRGALAGLYDTRRRSIDTALACLDNPDDIKVYDSLDALCEDPEVDAVIVASPNHTHRETLEKAIRGHKHILMQKPLAASIEDAWAMLQAVQGYDRVVMMYLEYRLKPMYLHAAHEVFVRKSIGDVKRITIDEHRGPFLNKAGQWNKFSEYSGGTLVEKCCHYFDLFNLFAGARPRRVFASGSAAVHYKDFVYEGRRSDILDNAYAIVEFENDTRACLDLCMFARGHRESICLNGDRGWLSAEDGPSARIKLKSDNGSPDAEFTATWPHGGAHSGASVMQAELFADAIDGKTDSYATAVDGFWSVVLGVAAETSVRTGGPVLIPELLASCGCPPEGPDNPLWRT